MEDTIVAISTTMGVGAISIIRLSGVDSISIVNKCFRGKDLNSVASHTINYGHIYDNEELIDEVLVSVMKAPKTFTVEDIVEINCHGGINTTNKILETILNNGARLAEPGEFTKRAFLNGRIDLIESEAVMDLINSKTNESRKIALASLNGKTSGLITDFRNKLKELLSSIEVNIDYPEYQDIEVITKEKISFELTEMIQKLKELIKESEQASLITNGIKTVILGKPNVGKSSILNNLLEEDKAIVTSVAGTTRDTVEGELFIDGVLLKIIDTAGIRKTDDIVEKIGVEKSLSMIDQADLVIVVLNNNEKLSEEDQQILDKTKDKIRIIVVNKNDLEKKLTLESLDLENVITTNTNNKEGIQPLITKIKNLFIDNKIKTKDYSYLSNVRQISKAKEAYQNLIDAKTALADDIPIDMIELDLKSCFSVLGEIIGVTYSEEIINNLFEKFCVGK